MGVVNMNQWYQHNQTEGWKSKEILISSGIHISLWSCCFQNPFRHNTSVIAPFFGLGYVLNGSVLCTINNDTLEFQQQMPHAQFLNQAVSCTEYAPGESISYLQISLSPKTFNRYWALSGSNHQYTFQSFVTDGKYSIRQMPMEFKEKAALIDLVRALESSKEEINRLLLESRILELLSINLCRLNGQEPAEDIYTYQRSSIQLAHDTLMTRLESPPSLAELSKIIGLNECSLKRGFKEQYGYTVYSFIQRQRLEKAYVLLTKEGFNVSQSALEVGYSNLSHFTKIFREMFGLNPGELVKRK